MTYLYGRTARVEFTVAYPAIERCMSTQDPRASSSSEVIRTREGLKQTGKQLTYHLYTQTCLMKFEGRAIIGTGTTMNSVTSSAE